MRVTNRATNSLPSSIAGWTTSSGYVRTFETVLGRLAMVCTRAAASPGVWLWYARNVGTLGTSTGTPTSPVGLVPATPGEVLNVFVDVGTSTANTKANVTIRSFTSAGAEMVGVAASGASVDLPVNGWTTISARNYVVPAGAAYVYVEFGIQLKTGNTVGGERSWASHVYIGTGDGWFHPDTADGAGVAYGWDGTPGLSTSYRVDSIDLVHWWTRKWYDSLPNAYRMADRVQDPSVGYFPLLRWMNGVGAIAGEIRDLSDAVWDGSLTDVERVPDAALRWVAQLLGMSDAQRSVTSAELRTALRELLTSGRRAVGTRGAIAEVAKRFLTGEKQVTVVPSSTTKNTIVLLVRAAEVPAGDLNALVANVRAAGAVPAGHNLLAVNAIATWDSFMAAAGVTWDELDAKTKTWAQHDTLGVDLTGA